jgi:hypothetical protein
MSRRVLVPLFRLEVEYQVKHGRRWSALEHLILWGCSDPIAVQDLASRADVPVRLVSECLVNLLRAGWIELVTSHETNVFRATGAGKDAAAKPLPDLFMEMQRRSTLVYMDRLSGEIFGPRELTVVRRDAPDFRAEEAIEPKLHRYVLQGPELVERLPLQEDDTFDRLRSARLVPSDLFSVISLEPGLILGLPLRTPAVVGLEIRAALERAIQRGDMPADGLPSQEAVLGTALADRRQAVPFDFGPDTIIVGGEEHRDAASAIIGQARRIVVIHSTFVGGNIKGLMPAIRSAASAGAHIHIHWGKQDDPERLQENPSEVAARMAVFDVPIEHRDKVHLGSSSTGSHAKIIIADTGVDGQYEALVGSCNWLDSPFRSVEASVRLTEPEPIARLAGGLAAILVPVLGHDVVVDRLIAIQGECASLPRSNGSHSIMLVVDDDHYTAVRDAMNETGKNGTVLLGSHKFGHAGETTVLDPMRAAARQGSRVKLFFTKTVPNFDPDAAAAKQDELAAQAIELRRAGEEMHAKFIGWNSKLLVTSFNFLSASVNGRHRGGSEFGALLIGPGVLEDFECKLRAKGVFSSLQSEDGQRRKRRRRRRKRTIRAQAG